MITKLQINKAMLTITNNPGNVSADNLALIELATWFMEHIQREDLLIGTGRK